MPYNTNEIWAGTEVGLFISDDNGASWNYADNGLPPVCIWDMRIVGDEVVLGTHGLGIWSVQRSLLSTDSYFPYLKKWYPTHRFIQIVRDPRDNYASIKSGWTKRYQHQFDSSERLLQSVMDRAVGGLKLATYYQRAFPKEYYVIRFEDLVMRPKTVMKKLSTFLDIPFENSLTMPTFMGQPWKGNNFEEQSFRKISTKNRNQWKKRITDEEAKILEFYFSESIKVFGYSPVFSEKACAEAAGRHYAWFNYAQPYSPKLEWR